MNYSIRKLCLYLTIVISAITISVHAEVPATTPMPALTESADPIKIDITNPNECLSPEDIRDILQGVLNDTVQASVFGGRTYVSTTAYKHTDWIGNWSGIWGASDTLIAAFLSDLARSKITVMDLETQGQLKQAAQKLLDYGNLRVDPKTKRNMKWEITDIIGFLSPITDAPYPRWQTFDVTDIDRVSSTDIAKILNGFLNDEIAITQSGQISATLLGRTNPLQTFAGGWYASDNRMAEFFGEIVAAHRLNLADPAAQDRLKEAARKLMSYGNLTSTSNADMENLSQGAFLLVKDMPFPDYLKIDITDVSRLSPWKINLVLHGILRDEVEAIKADGKTVVAPTTYRHTDWFGNWMQSDDSMATFLSNLVRDNKIDLSDPVMSENLTKAIEKIMSYRGEDSNTELKNVMEYLSPPYPENSLDTSIFSFYRNVVDIKDLKTLSAPLIFTIINSFLNDEIIITRESDGKAIINPTTVTRVGFLQNFIADWRASDLLMAEFFRDIVQARSLNLANPMVRQQFTKAVKKLISEGNLNLYGQLGLQMQELSENLSNRCTIDKSKPKPITSPTQPPVPTIIPDTVPELVPDTSTPPSPTPTPDTQPSEPSMPLEEPSVPTLTISPPEPPTSVSPVSPVETVSPEILLVSPSGPEDEAELILALGKVGGPCNSWIQCQDLPIPEPLPPKVVSEGSTDITLVTAYDELSGEHANLTIPHQMDYAKQHQYSYYAYEGNLVAPVASAEVGASVPRDASWSKIVAIMDRLSQMPDGAWLVWIDDTVVFTNWEHTWEEVIEEFGNYEGIQRDIIVTKDAEGAQGSLTPINDAVMVIRNTPWSRAFFQRVWDQDQWENEDAQEQQAIGRLWEKLNLNASRMLRIDQSKMLGRAQH